METCESPNQNDFNSIELRASSISFKIDNCSYLNLQNKIVSILNESNVTEYSCAATPQIRQTGNRLSGLAETAYASLLAQCFV